MKILYVTTISNTANLFLVPHIRFLIEQRNEVGLAFNNEGISMELGNLGCKIHEVEFQRNPLKRENFRAIKKLKSIIYEEGYELIHVHTPVASFITRFACRKMESIQVLYTAHGFHFYKGAPKRNWALYYPLEKMASKWTDGVITINEEDYQAAKKFQLKRNNSVYKVHGIGVDLQKFHLKTNEEKVKLRTEYQYHQNEFILITVGELAVDKGQDLLIDAVSLLKDKIPNLRLLVVGDGKLKKRYMDQANHLGINNLLNFLGYREDIPNLMALSDVAVSTSKREGLPVNVMEAMATGLSLIVTNVRGNRDLVLDNKNGFVIGKEDVEACAEAILKLNRSEEVRKRFSIENRRKIVCYSQEYVIQELSEIYKDFYREEDKGELAFKTVRYP